MKIAGIGLGRRLIACYEDMRIWIHIVVPHKSQVPDASVIHHWVSGDMKVLGVHWLVSLVKVSYRFNKRFCFRKQEEK